MRKFTRIFAMLIGLVLCFNLCACEAEASADYGSLDDVKNTQEAANLLQYNQPTPTDIDYSLERYNLTRRAYWVNGQREKANWYLHRLTKIVEG